MMGECVMLATISWNSCLITLTNRTGRLLIPNQYPSPPASYCISRLSPITVQAHSALRMTSFPSICSPKKQTPAAHLEKQMRDSSRFTSTPHQAWFDIEFEFFQFSGRFTHWQPHDRVVGECVTSEPLGRCSTTEWGTVQDAFVCVLSGSNSSRGL